MVNKKICEIEWPAESVVASIRRGGRLIVPRGDIPIRVGDTLTIVAAPEVEDDLEVLTGMRVD